MNRPFLPRRKRRVETTPSQSAMVVEPSGWGTIVLVAGLITAAFLGGATPQEIGFRAAVCVGASLLLSLWIEIRHNPRTLCRTDLVALVALYYLIFFEFLQPGESLRVVLTASEMRDGVRVSLLGFLGIALGRHLDIGRSVGRSIETMVHREIARPKLLIIFFLCLLIGYFHMLLAVNFNVAKMFDSMFTAGRFGTPWQRGQLGNWKTLLNELAGLLYLCPALAGMMFARPGRFGFWSKILVVIGLLLTVAQGISTGTRFVMMGYVCAFVTVYILSLPGLNFTKLLRIILPASAVVMAVTVLLLQFRSRGMSRSVSELSAGETEVNTSNFEVDRNLSVIAKIVSSVPSLYQYIGSELYVVTLVRPIPRALWPGKPEGVSVSPATVIEETQATIASTFVGESYLSRGIVAVSITGLVLGWLMAIWNRVGARLTCNGSILVYTSGVFAFVLTMRSITEFFAILMPTLAAIVLVRIFGEKTVDVTPIEVTATGTLANGRIARPHRQNLRPFRIRARKPEIRSQRAEVRSQKSE